MGMQLYSLWISNDEFYAVDNNPWLILREIPWHDFSLLPFSCISSLLMLVSWQYQASHPEDSDSLREFYASAKEVLLSATSLGSHHKDSLILILVWIIGKSWKLIGIYQIGRGSLRNTMAMDPILNLLGSMSACYYGCA